MEIRKGYYALLDKEIIEMISVENGFEYTTTKKYIIDKYNFLYNGYAYRLPINKTNNLSAFRISNYCTYKGMKFFIDNNSEDRLLLRPSSDEAEIFLGFKPYQRGASEASIVVTIDEVEEIWEERTPIEGFKFDVEPIHYLKKDGKFFE